jgi:hypothetical protein
LHRGDEVLISRRWDAQPGGNGTPKRGRRGAGGSGGGNGINSSSNKTAEARAQELHSFPPGHYVWIVDTQSYRPLDTAKVLQASLASSIRNEVSINMRKGLRGKVINGCKQGVWDVRLECTGEVLRCKYENMQPVLQGAAAPAQQNVQTASSQRILATCKERESDMASFVDGMQLGLSEQQRAAVVAFLQDPRSHPGWVSTTAGGGEEGAGGGGGRGEQGQGGWVDQRMVVGPGVPADDASWLASPAAAGCDVNGVWVGSDSVEAGAGAGEGGERPGEDSSQGDEDGMRERLDALRSKREAVEKQVGYMSTLSLYLGVEEVEG